ncbi:hypothetical protein C8Q75DRAFT_753076 [Abortiporus biennis]|nr:hypothetical protein C8Q75DRAFT_753076 [Abortiporus biennis]
MHQLLATTFISVFSILHSKISFKSNFGSVSISFSFIIVHSCFSLNPSTAPADSSKQSHSLLYHHNNHQIRRIIRWKACIYGD